MKSFRLNRRSFLRGAGGVALALPALEIMLSPGRASAGGAANMRFFLSYVASSSGRTYYANGDQCCGETVNGDLITPDVVGPGYDLKGALVPLGAADWEYSTGFGGVHPGYGVQDEVTIVSGLRIPTNATLSEEIPPGGRTLLFHGSTVVPQISGTRALDRGTAPLGPTADQMVADAFDGDTVHRSLVYRVQPINYHSGDANSGNMGRLAWRRTEDGSVVPIDPVVNPRTAWESLFTGFAPADPAETAKVLFELQQRRSVLDVVAESTQALLPRLGHEDRMRLERHHDEIRALEGKLELFDPGGGACEELGDPGEDWPIGEANGDGEETPTNKYSNEEERAEVLLDLVHMAFTCGLTRAASVQFERWKSYLNMTPLVGAPCDLHDLTHFSPGSNLARLSDGLAWHVKHFARLVAKLRDTPEIDGVPLLDRTVLAMIFEGGHEIGRAHV